MNVVSSMLFPVLCPGCGCPGSAPCVDCADRCERADPLAAPAGIDAALAVLRYDGVTRELIISLKYRGGRMAARWLTHCMSSEIADSWSERRFDVVTWIPAAPRQRRHRGFDQGELLAAGVAAQMQLRCTPLLTRRGQRQTGLQRADRLVGPSLGCWRELSGQHVLLIDDVITTGASIAAAGRALRSAGASEIFAAAAAATPPG